MIKTASEPSFAYSRIFAQGWNAARRSSVTTAAANPYKTEPERTRWNEGFAKGMQ